MKVVEWKYLNDIDINIDNYLELGNKADNTWWKTLPSLIGFFKNHVEYFTNSYNKLKETGNIEAYRNEITPATAKLCPAIGKGLLDKTLLVKTPCDIAINIDSGYMSWKTPDTDLLDIQSHSQEQLYSVEDNPFEGYMNIKIRLPVYIRTNGLPYIYLEPQYHKQPNYPLKVVNGVIEGKYTKGQRLNINTILQIPTSSRTIVIPAKTVLGYIWFPEKVKLKHNPSMRKHKRATFMNSINNIY